MSNWTAIGVEFGIPADSVLQAMKRWCRLNGREWPVVPVKQRAEGEDECP